MSRLVATYATWKGHEIVLDAAARLAASAPDLPVRHYLIGGPIYISSVAAIVLGITTAGGAWQGIGGAFMFVWELALALWLTFRGFSRTAPIVVDAMAGTAG